MIFLLSVSHIDLRETYVVWSNMNQYQILRNRLKFLFMLFQVMRWLYFLHFSMFISYNAIQ